MPNNGSSGDNYATMPFQKEKSMPDNGSSGIPAFKRTHDRYRKKKELDKDVMDPRTTIPTASPIKTTPLRSTPLGWECVAYPGAVLFRLSLSRSTQLGLAYAALTQYCEDPHRTNMDLVPPKPNETVVPTSTMWQQLHHNKNQTSPTRPYRCFRKLSWATLGYHYDWTSRCYRKEDCSPVPTVLSQIGAYFANLLFLLSAGGEEEPSSSCHSYTVQACIVNYYQTKSVMGGHRDDLEVATDQPILSISLGRPAIYLQGGPTLDDPAIPILLRSGDVLALGGVSRLNYHSMACLLHTEADAAPTTTIKGEEEVEHRFDNVCVCPNEELSRVEAFLSTHRININLRQVYPHYSSDNR